MPRNKTLLGLLLVAILASSSLSHQEEQAACSIENCSDCTSGNFFNNDSCSECRPGYELNKQSNFYFFTSNSCVSLSSNDLQKTAIPRLFSTYNQQQQQSSAEASALLQICYCCFCVICCICIFQASQKQRREREQERLRQQFLINNRPAPTPYHHVVVQQPVPRPPQPTPQSNITQNITHVNYTIQAPQPVGSNYIQPLNGQQFNYNQNPQQFYGAPQNTQNTGIGLAGQAQPFNPYSIPFPAQNQRPRSDTPLLQEIKVNNSGFKENAKGSGDVGGGNTNYPSL